MRCKIVARAQLEDEWWQLTLKCGRIVYRSPKQYRPTQTKCRCRHGADADTGDYACMDWDG